MFASHVRLVHLDEALQVGPIRDHRAHDLAPHGPGRLVGDVQLPGDLRGGQRLGGRRDEVDGHKPLQKRGPRKVEDRAGGGRRAW